MTYAQLNAVLDETGMSPEKLAPIFSVGSMTIRRWQKASGKKKVSEVDQWNIIESIYKLVLDGKLSTKSELVQAILKDSTPGSFQAISLGMGASVAVLNSAGGQQDNMMLMLSQIGGVDAHKVEVEKSSKKLSYFKKMGSEWQSRISGLVDVTRSAELTLLDKMVAYGALFYLITPFDLIPDHIPVVGLIDDFGILGFAVAFYVHRFPKLFSDLKEPTGLEKSEPE